MKNICARPYFIYKNITVVSDSPVGPSNVMLIDDVVVFVSDVVVGVFVAVRLSAPLTTMIVLVMAVVAVPMGVG